MASQRGAWKEHPVARRLLRLGRLSWQAWQQFGRDYCMMLAAALSFYAILSLIPLTFVGLWMLSRWFGPERAYQMMTEVVQQQIPHAAQVIIGQVDVIRQGGERWLVGSIWGILPLAWAGATFYEGLERILTAAWAGRPLRGYLQRKLVTVTTFLCAVLFFGASLLATAALTAISRLDIEVFGVGPRDFPWFWKLAGLALPFFFSVGMFFLLYKFLPNTRVPTHLAFKAAAIAGVAWEWSKSLFTRFIAREQTYQHLYGSLTGVVMLMLWIYVSALILLLGAELAAAYHYDETGRTRPDRPEE